MSRFVTRTNDLERTRSISASASWHTQFSHTACIFIGNLSPTLTAGDIITVFSQYGEILDFTRPINKPDENSNKSQRFKVGTPKPFAFMKYADQRSTVLAVDNLNGFQLVGKALRVDHAESYRREEMGNVELQEIVDREGGNVAPAVIRWMNERKNPKGQQKRKGDSEDSDVSLEGVDPDDPMYEYFKSKKRKKKHKASKKQSRKEEKRYGNDRNVRDRGDDRHDSRLDERKGRQEDRHRRDNRQRDRHEHDDYRSGDRRKGPAGRDDYHSRYDDRRQDRKIQGRKSSRNYRGERER